jgi:dephospho-CoA kinase
MLRLKKIAVTGSISCGKTLVCNLLKQYGAYVVSADRIVHQLLSIHTSTGQSIISLLGNDVVINGLIDRRVISKKVFNNPQLLKNLENIIHPKVFSEIKNEFQEVKTRQLSTLFIAEVPLLFEGQLESWFDKVIVVTAPEEQCIQRFIKSTGYSHKDYQQRMSYQIPLKQKEEKADFLIENKGNRKELNKQALHIYKHLCAT